MNNFLKYCAFTCIITFADDHPQRGGGKIQGFKDSGFKSIYLQQPIHFATVLINKTYSTITRQIEITNNH